MTAWSPAILVARVSCEVHPCVRYDVWLQSGRYICTCTTFQFRGHCSHATRIEAQGLTHAIER